MTEATCDEILRGRLRLWQPRAGYRFNVDSLLLARFASVGERARVADLCAGVGVIGLAIAARLPSVTVALAELQPHMAALARRNVDENRLAARVTVAEVDLADRRAARRALAGAAWDHVVSSPPYFTRAQGPTVPDSSEAIARHEIRIDLPSLCAEAKRLLAPGGRAALVFPSERLPELLGALAAAGLRPSRLQVVHPRPSAPANRVLVEAVKGGRGALAVDPPLYVRDEGGAYSPAARDALGEP